MKSFPQVINESAVAARLLVIFASGGTLERIVADLPTHKAQIESVLGLMKTAGRCSDAEIAERAIRLPEILQRKNQAIRRQDFDLAAKMRAEECALFESFRLATPKGMDLDVGIDEQIGDLATLFDDATLSQR